MSNSYYAHDHNSRLRAISINAVRETLFVRGRLDRPYTDNDAAIAENIYHLLQSVEDRDYVKREDEHQPLAAQIDGVNDTQTKVAEALGLLDAEIRAETAAAQASRAGSTEA